MSDEYPLVMPPPLLRASSQNFPMGHLIFSWRDTRSERDYWRHDTETEWLMGHRMPPFQRPPVWTEEQGVRFIESAWMGLHLGTYVVNRNEQWTRTGPGPQDMVPHRTDLWLVDGQQRLRSIQAYLEGRWPVFGYLWPDLPRHERARFSNLTFTMSTVHEGDEGVLRELYNRLNFGGTAHTEDQRA